MSSGKFVVLAASSILLLVLALPSFAIFEKDLPILTATGEKTRGKIEVENDKDSRFRSYDVRLNIGAAGLKPRALYTVWLVERKDGGEQKGLGVADYSFTSDGEGRGRFYATMPEYEFARWDILEIRHHPNGDAKDVAGSVVVQRAELWRAHPY